MVSHEFSIYRLCSEDDTKVLKSHSGMRVVKSSPDRRQQIMTTTKKNQKKLTTTISGLRLTRVSHCTLEMKKITWFVT